MRVYLGSWLSVCQLAVSLLLPLLVVLTHYWLGVRSLRNILASLGQERFVSSRVVSHRILSVVVLELLQILLLELMTRLICGNPLSLILKILHVVLQRINFRLVLLFREILIRSCLSGNFFVSDLVHVERNLLGKQTGESRVYLVLDAELLCQLLWIIIFSYQNVSRLAISYLYSYSHQFVRSVLSAVLGVLVNRHLLLILGLILLTIVIRWASHCVIL